MGEQGRVLQSNNRFSCHKVLDSALWTGMLLWWDHGPKLMSFKCRVFHSLVDISTCQAWLTDFPCWNKQEPVHAAFSSGLCISDNHLFHYLKRFLNHLKRLVRSEHYISSHNLCPTLQRTVHL
jgi:hypothetical protein